MPQPLNVHCLPTKCSFNLASTHTPATTRLITFLLLEVPMNQVLHSLFHTMLGLQLEGAGGAGMVLFALSAEAPRFLLGYQYDMYVVHFVNRVSNSLNI